MSLEKASKYGVIKVENMKVKLYYSQSSYSLINVGYDIKDARWIGNEVVIYLSNGKIKKYKSQSSYITI